MQVYNFQYGQCFCGGTPYREMPNTTGSSAIARHERAQVGKLLALRSEKLVADLGRLQRAGVILVLDN